MDQLKVYILPLGKIFEIFCSTVKGLTARYWYRVHCWPESGLEKPRFWCTKRTEAKFWWKQEEHPKHGSHWTMHRTNRLL